mmetsp:Transcript_102498/g.290268  ORF Transcript_102498/g.290268 Transcript_102498/m.290268 type:complete len:267 (+) Transcript_102498:483-1283(+)
MATSPSSMRTGVGRGHRTPPDSAAPSAKARRTASGRYVIATPDAPMGIRRGQPGPSGPMGPPWSRCHRKNLCTSWWPPRMTAVCPRPGTVWLLRATITNAVKLPRESVFSLSCQSGAKLVPTTSADSSFRYLPTSRGFPVAGSSPSRPRGMSPVQLPSTWRSGHPNSGHAGRSSLGGSSSREFCARGGVTATIPPTGSEKGPISLLSSPATQLFVTRSTISGIVPSLLPAPLGPPRCFGAVMFHRLRARSVSSRGTAPRRIRKPSR